MPVEDIREIFIFTHLWKKINAVLSVSPLLIYWHYAECDIKMIHSFLQTNEMKKSTSWCLLCVYLLVSNVFGVRAEPLLVGLRASVFRDCYL